MASANTLDELAPSRGPLGSGRTALRFTAVRTRAWLDHDGLRPFRVAAGAVFALQLAVLSVYSAYLYRHFDLTSDFAIYSQAWSSIGQGHLNPSDTVQIPALPFWRSHFELAMWPIAIISRIWSTPIVLLWLQDIAIVATQAIAACWMVAICAQRLRRHRNAVAIVALLSLVANPWWYETASFDIHFEVLALPFVVLAGYALWRSWTRVAWIAGACALLFGDVAALYIVGVGLGGLLSRKVRRQGQTPAAAGLLILGLAWLTVVSALHANQNSALVANYGYLAGVGPHATSMTVIWGMIGHPQRAIHVLAARWGLVKRLLLGAGLIGVLTPWGFGICVVALVPVALNQNVAFISPGAAFQTDVIIPFVLLGTWILLIRLATFRRWLAGLAAMTLLVGAVWETGDLLALRSQWWKVDAYAASTLSTVLRAAPPYSEVIASKGIVGRFADRSQVFAVWAGRQTFPVRGTDVLFILDGRQGLEAGDPGTSSAVAYVRDHLGARTIADRAGIYAAEWRCPRGTTAVVLP